MKVVFCAIYIGIYFFAVRLVEVISAVFSTEYDVIEVLAVA